MDLIFDDDHVDVVVTWSRRMRLARFLDGATRLVETGDQFLYLLSTGQGRQERCVYVGQSYSGLVRHRLLAPDHRRKQAGWAALAGGDAGLHVRLGAPVVAGKGPGAITARLVDDVEAILIYALDDGDATRNIRSRRRHRIGNYYEIRNHGLPRAAFPQRIGYGVYWDR